ncbi:MAG: BON domain-containing protein [Bacteriovorax sp.]|nr:BON domain-containing protein [Bacteriovorax sp.]
MFKLTFQSFIKILACLVLFTTFSGCSSTKKDETPGQYVDDSIITTKVKNAIFNEPTLKTMQISVKTHQGLVQLSGFVNSSNDVSKAGEVAKNVDNVVSVKNDLIVK